MFSLDRTASRIVGGLFTFCVIVTISLAVGYCQQREKAAQARQEARVSKGTTNAAKDAVTVTDGVLRGEQGQRDLDQENRDAIQGTDNAKSDAGEAGRAGIRAICRRLPDEPACRRD